MAKHIRTLNSESLQTTAKTGGCGECQTSCQSACKTSCTVGNQVCKQKIILSQGIEGLPEGRPFCFVLRGTATISNNMLYLIAGLFRSRYNTDLVEALC